MLIAIGNSGAKLVGGFMLVSASISMWVMNTSTTLMLLPIGLAVCASVAETIPNFSAKERKNFETSLACLVLPMLLPLEECLPWLEQHQILFLLALFKKHMALKFLL